MTIPIPNPHIAVSMLAFFQGTQLNLFERFLTQAVAGIDSTSITSGMQNVAYVILLVGFLWQVYQSALHGCHVGACSYIKIFLYHSTHWTFRPIGSMIQRCLRLSTNRPGSE